MMADMETAELPAFVSRQEAAELLGVTPQALSQMSVRGEGPKYVKVGRSVRYRRADLLAWIDERIVDPAGPRKAG
jgi:excisionase family DNA binding protein